MGWKRPTCIAEIGGNHEGCFKTACDLVDLALSTPIDVIKFQTYFADTLVEKSADPQRWSHFKKFELTIDQHLEIAQRVKKAGKIYSTSIWDQESFSVLKDYLSFIKIGSGDANAYTFLKIAAETGLPIILSTGLCKQSEVEQSVKLLRKFNSVYNKKENLTLLQCTSMYPIPETEVNLNVLEAYRKLGVQVGYSDHTVGVEAIQFIAAQGCDVIEFHFTDNKYGRTFRDHAVSLDQANVIEFYNFLNRCERMSGTAIKAPTKSEVENSHLKSFRRGTYVREKILAGTKLDDRQLIEKRPDNDGLRYIELIGKTVLRDLDVGEKIRQEDVY